MSEATSVPNVAVCIAMLALDVFGYFSVGLI